MDQNLTYQKARRIRGTKLTDLLADQLLYEPTIGKAIKKTISLKTQSSIKGIKEKFDSSTKKSNKIRSKINGTK